LRWLLQKLGWLAVILAILLAALACSFLAKRITVAKLYHFDSDSDRLLRRSVPAAGGRPAGTGRRSY